jgi:hypothetical protein
MEVNYYEKYMKYKLKYIELLGGAEPKDTDVIYVKDSFSKERFLTTYDTIKSAKIKKKLYKYENQIYYYSTKYEKEYIELYNMAKKFLSEKNKST